MAKKEAIVLLADGFEEVEAVTPVDYLRRAGVEVTVAAVGGSLTVKGARARLLISADVTLARFLERGSSRLDAVIVPGGMPGAANLAACPNTNALLKEMAAAGKLICAICASPAVVLAPLGLLSGRRFTCFPGMEEKAVCGQGSRGIWSRDLWSQERVVVDGNIITSRAAGTAGEFSIAIIEALLGAEEGKKVAEAVLLGN